MGALFCPSYAAVFFKPEDFVCTENCKISFLISVLHLCAGPKVLMKNCNGFHIPHSVVIRIAFQSYAQRKSNKPYKYYIVFAHRNDDKMPGTNLATAVKMQFS